MLAGGDPGPVTSDIELGRKDLGTMLAEAKTRGLELPLVERTLASYDEASRKGLGGQEAASLAVYWAKRKAS
jgi:3-hydroxyisobutyrate dehydrogenase